MKLFFFLLGSLSMILAPHESLASRKIYFFDSKNEICKDSQGRSGFNLDTWGECTDFTHKRLKKGSSRQRLERKNSVFVGSNFESTNLSTVHFHGTDLRFASFRNAKLHNVIFEDVDLRSVDFRGADLSGVTFLGSRPEKRYQLQGSIFDDETILMDDNGILPSTRAFAFSKDMVRTPFLDGSEQEIQLDGVVFQGLNSDKKLENFWAKIAWSYPVTRKLINLYVPNTTLFKQIQSLQLGQKVRISFRNQELISIEPK